MQGWWTSRTSSQMLWIVAVGCAFLIVFALVVNSSTRSFQLRPSGPVQAEYETHVQPAMASIASGLTAIGLPVVGASGIPDIPDTGGWATGFGPRTYTWDVSLGDVPYDWNYDGDVFQVVERMLERHGFTFTMAATSHKAGGGRVYSVKEWEDWFVSVDFRRASVSWWQPWSEQLVVEVEVLGEDHEPTNGVKEP
jgi:hypothetical protein